MPRIEEPPEPWRSFFAEVDAHLRENVHLHCCGGFVMTQLYGVPRTTSDVDFLGAVPDVRREITEIAGKGSALHQKYRVYLDAVTVATPPESYEERLLPMFPGAWVHLRLDALEAHDLALSKLERNMELDRQDVQHLARAGHLKPEVLRERYFSELRPNLLAHEARHDLTLQLWLESYWPV
ncbi:conserved hypothetical protein [Candidatus Sulfopaludibacter sp. SbA4]|nr:conserved hypothetical protein [Candidatus Sulfopaludibacter sp. SbA4]